MADRKQYVTHAKDNGAILISEDVIAAIAVQSLVDIEGCAGINGKSNADMIEFIGKKKWGKGVKVTISEKNRVSVVCNVIVMYGTNVVEVAAEIQKAVKLAIRSTIGISAVRVHVNICGLVRK